VTRPTWAQVDLRAIRSNVESLRRLVAPARFMAVVKADGYGHGAVEVAAAAIAAGADSLGVALVEEGVTLRDAGIGAPILLLSEVDHASLRAAAAWELTPTVCTRAGVHALEGSDPPIAVHLKIDTGMHRAGCDPSDALDIATLITSTPGVVLEGVWTHCAVADEHDATGTATQLTRFRNAVEALRGAGIGFHVAHAANSAALLAHRESRLDLVRCGIALYGVAPAPALAAACVLEPALSLVSHVSAVRTVAAGESVSYGWRWTAPAPTRIATVPIGYADGVPRALGLHGGEVLLRGRTRPIAGVVTMDQLMVDTGDPGSDTVEIGDEVVLLGSQGPTTIGAWDWAQRLGTIAYEILTGVGPRVPRRYVG
jgi:alanine racemase